MYNDFDNMPLNKLVIVYDAFQGFGLRSKTYDGNWYDENDSFDDSETEWEYWDYLPPTPK